ncbi:Tetratricopeptide-like helical [Fusarium albosuccineum]|uniref:Tetratricopeptide-like helical n=1 Tax=Fusarium albosuccineum TaxID=1237068 RepID=A0A8H4PDN0_9HYPO|nr:Tetratricopeptide-like helical [Fusarium albosuccineum]
MTLGNPAHNAALPQPRSTTLGKEDIDIRTRRKFHSEVTVGIDALDECVSTLGPLGFLAPEPSFCSIFYDWQRNASDIRPLTHLNLYEASAASPRPPQLQVASRTRANTLLFFQRAGVFSNKLMDSSVRQVSGHSSVRDSPLDGDKDARNVGTETPSKSDAASTRKCLEVLLQDDYARVDLIGKRLKKSFRLDDSIQEPFNISYADAARNWYIHLKKLTSPDQTLLELVAKFLRTPQFAYWVEYSYTDPGDFQAIRSAEIALTVWSNCLPESDKALIHLDDYFELPYSDLARTYEHKGDDKLL